MNRFLLFDHLTLDQSGLSLLSRSFQVLFCRLTDYQKELYEDFIHGPEVEMMLSGRKHVCVCARAIVLCCGLFSLLLFLFFLPSFSSFPSSLFPLLLLSSSLVPHSSSSFLQIFSGLMTLRKLCNHPDLVTNDFSELVRNEKGEGEEGEEEEGDFEILNVPGRKKKKWPLRG